MREDSQLGNPLPEISKKSELLNRRKDVFNGNDSPQKRSVYRAHVIPIDRKGRKAKVHNPSAKRPRLSNLEKGPTDISTASGNGMIGIFKILDFRAHINLDISNEELNKKICYYTAQSSMHPSQPEIDSYSKLLDSNSALLSDFNPLFIENGDGTKPLNEVCASLKEDEEVQPHVPTSVMIGEGSLGYYDENISTELTVGACKSPGSALGPRLQIENSIVTRSSYPLVKDTSSENPKCTSDDSQVSFVDNSQVPPLECPEPIGLPSFIGECPSENFEENLGFPSKDNILAGTNQNMKSDKKERSKTEDEKEHGEIYDSESDINSTLEFPDEALPNVQRQNR